MLRWDWKKSIGYVITKEESNGQIIEFKNYLYTGNAMLIMIWEQNHEEGTGKYQLTKFFTDKEHFKNCLKDCNGDWIFRDMDKIVIQEIPTKDQWLFLQEAVKRGIEVLFEKRPFN